MALQLVLNRVIVFAPDLDGARRFFADVLGLRLVRDEGGPLTFEGSNFALTVFECEGGTVTDTYSQRAGVSLSFLVPSLEEAMSELSGKGVRFLHASPKVGPVGRYVAFVDPFGTVFELVEE